MNKNTSWEKVGDWYKNTVGEKGSYYHQKIILPNVIRLLNLKKNSRLLDLGCGQGILARSIPMEIEYLGIDLSASLIEESRRLDNNRRHAYAVADVSRELPIRSSGFSEAAVILALQNIRHPFGVFRNLSKHLSEKGRAVIVINHPCFRIPKHSDWTVNDNIQYRREDNYMTKLEIPIESSPYDQKNNQTTWSFHYPLSAYSEMLFDNGMVIEKIEEWISDKKSEGGKAQIEDKARKEFPMFMALVVCRK